jgi:hypothetical protein
VAIVQAFSDISESAFCVIEFDMLTEASDRQHALHDLCTYVRCHNKQVLCVTSDSFSSITAADDFEVHTLSTNTAESNKQ